MWNDIYQYAVQFWFRPDISSDIQQNPENATSMVW